jgi:hypothetical protein
VTARTRRVSFTGKGWNWTSDALAAGQPLTSISCGTKKTCAFPVYESGTIAVTARLKGAGADTTATARVEVLPCAATGDSILDSPEVRQVMFSELAAGMKPSASSGNRRERGGLIYRRPDGSFVALPIPNTETNSCSYTEATPNPLVDPSWVRLVQWHTHPYKRTDRIYNCPRVPDGVRTPKPGPSTPDMMRARLARNQESYMVDGDGEVWRYNWPPLDPLHPEHQRARTWTRSAGSICLAQPVVKSF